MQEVGIAYCSSSLWTVTNWLKPKFGLQVCTMTWHASREDSWINLTFLVTEEVFLLLSSALYWHNCWSQFLVKWFDSLKMARNLPHRKSKSNYIFILLHSAASVYILKHKGRGRFEKKIHKHGSYRVCEKKPCLLEYNTYLGII